MDGATEFQRGSQVTGPEREDQGFKNLENDAETLNQQNSLWGNHQGAVCH